MMDQSEEPILSSGNVFADLGLDNAEEKLTKAQLGRAIRCLIREGNMTQEEAARRMGTTQPKVCAIMGGKMVGFTADRLLEYIKRLDYDVDITISKSTQEQSRGKVRVIYAG